MSCEPSAKIVGPCDFDSEFRSHGSKQWSFFGGRPPPPPPDRRSRACSTLRRCLCRLRRTRASVRAHYTSHCGGHLCLSYNVSVSRLTESFVSCDFCESHPTTSSTFLTSWRFSTSSIFNQPWSLPSSSTTTTWSTRPPCLAPTSTGK